MTWFLTSKGVLTPAPDDTGTTSGLVASGKWSINDTKFSQLSSGRTTSCILDHTNYNLQYTWYRIKISSSAVNDIRNVTIICATFMV